MPDRRTRSLLRDVDRDCTHRFNTSGRPMPCQLPAGHDGLHKHDCTRWSDQHSIQPVRQP
ncbi:hypothetical protein [Streptomyces lavendulocolor]|uniref:hypothetical protein n=1 Tax=Streptomyces lavendulocolor TaxID=67316 RepID=UPI0033E9EBDD